MGKQIECWFDGVTEPVNPGGHGAWGAVVKVDGATVFSEGGYVGHGKHVSNNVSEYAGFVATLTEALKHAEKGDKIHIRGDSRLVICQLFEEAARALSYSGKWKVNGGFYMPYHEQAKSLLASIKGIKVTAEWISRDKNDICDVLSKQQLHDRGVIFKIQPE